MSMAAESTNNTPTVAELLGGLENAPQTRVTGIASDSRKVVAGDLFIACQGLTRHGVEFALQAEERGAAAIVWDKTTAAVAPTTQLPHIGVEHLAAQLGGIASLFYAMPSRQLGVVGVTGTNGKTSVAWLIAQCLQLMQRRCAYLGTLGYGVDELQADEGMTTPAAVELQARLAEFVDQGATALALEVSSHALSQQRVDGVEFDAAIFTNLTRDHLDYHGDMEAYFSAKSELFLRHRPTTRIVNVDSEFGRRLAAQCGEDTIVVSTSVSTNVSTNNALSASNNPFLIVRNAMPTARGSLVQFDSTWGSGQFEINLPGEYNVANAAAVLTYVLSQGADLPQACDVMSLLSAPPGRMQEVAAGQPRIYVDYAHTPDALRAALRTLRPHCMGTLWCVFGCGGDRDQGKRSEMGGVAVDNADRVIVTNDNPRSESPADIIAQVVAGVADRSALSIIEDRASAIGWCIEQAASDDVVLIAGKGHESYQQLGNTRLRFSDLEVARSALKAVRCRQ